MKVGKEEICALLRAVELFFEMDEAAVVAEWQRRCQIIAEATAGIKGLEARFTKAYENKFPPASPLIHVHFDDSASKTATEVVAELEAGEPSILASGGGSSLTVGPQTLQDGEAEIIANRLRKILVG